MLTAVQFYNARGDMIEIPLAAAVGGSQYMIKKIDGLGAPKADILTASYVGMDGGVYQTSRGTIRNSVFYIGFRPNFTVDDAYGELRRALYAWLTPRMLTTMHFISDNMETVKLVGVIESNEPAIFDPNPSIQVSIISADCFFSSLTEHSVTENYPDIITIDNPGTIETGLTFLLNGASWPSPGTLFVTRQEPSIYPEEGANSLLNYTGLLYVVGEPITLRVITEKGKKSAKWMLTSDYDPDYVPPDPSDDQFNASVLGYINGWLNIVPGVNHFYPSFPSGMFPTTPEWTIFWTPKYAGL